MDSPVFEVKYPIKFRRQDTEILGEHLRLRHNVEIVGLKRVGIGDFLRFFLYHKDISKQYIDKTQKHLLISVDLNDLIEIKIFPFWILTFKRIVDSVEESTIDPKTKKHISNLFLDSIGQKSLFLTIENLRKALGLLIRKEVLPTVFFLRFDRLNGIINADFFANLAGIRESTGQKLSFVLTSFRPIEEIKSFAFTHVMYIRPAQKSDVAIILKALAKKYRLWLWGSPFKKLIEVSGGHAQYLYLCLIVLSQNKDKKDANGLLKLFLSDERVNLQSEEIWESLKEDEKTLLKAIAKDEIKKANLKDQGKYLLETGAIRQNEGKFTIFSPLFASFIKQNAPKTGENLEFTKKENSLFALLSEKKNDICEREEIIETVWPEYEELGVSDWTIDRLVARLRSKLAKKKSKFQIITVKTRGFKLVEEA